MILCHLDDVQPGMTVAAVVLHPRRPEVELLLPGAPIDRRLLERLKDLEVGEIWVDHPAASDLDEQLCPQLGTIQREVYGCLKEQFENLDKLSVTTASVLEYRQVIGQLVMELIGNRRVAGLSQRLMSQESGLFAHSANVAFLSVMAGLELENYLITERKRLAYDHAKDVTALGVGAMLHDIGKLTFEPARQQAGEVDQQFDSHQANPLEREAYRQHVLQGYRLLHNSHAAASATQIVLNHHQRFDGSGWPDMRHLTGGRHKGPQAGKQIHVFSRIVAAANVLDRLMSDAQGHRRPGGTVAALYDLASHRFDGWFDPLIRTVMLGRIPPFQVGSHVKLSDGRQAVVLAPNLKQPCRPTLRLIDPGQRLPDGSYPVLRLADEPALNIVMWAGQDVSRWYFELPSRQRQPSSPPSLPPSSLPWTSSSSARSSSQAFRVRR